MKRIKGCLAFSLLLLMALAGTAAAGDIDIEGVAEGTYTYIYGVGGAFAPCFYGQTCTGPGILGTPSSPLTLMAGGQLQVVPYDGSNSILPQPGNTASLSVLLDEPATNISWQMGEGAGGQVTIDFYAANGSLVDSVDQPLTAGYSTYEFTFADEVRGICIYNNSDPAGLRYQDFYYAEGFGLLAPPSGWALTSAPTLEWNAGEYDMFKVFCVFPYPGVGLYPVTFWTPETSYEISAQWFAAIQGSTWAYWLVVGVNTETVEYEMDGPWSFQKL